MSKAFSGVAAVLLLLSAIPGTCAISPAMQAALSEGPQALYNLDYAQARAKLRKLIETEPDNPFGYLFEAGAIWWESSNEYGLFKDTPTLERLFAADVEQALRKSKAYQNSPDSATQSEGNFVAGMALGTRGQWNLLRGRWIRAYFDGRKAVKDLNKALKLDPNFYDAYLGLGIYDYQAARLPGILKLSALFMVHGDEKRGLQRIQTAMERGRFVPNQAAVYLESVDLTDQKDYPAALKIIRRLRETFPDSVYFRFLEMTTLARSGDFDDSYRAAQDIFGRISGDPAILTRKQLTLLCGIEGSHCLNHKALDSTVQWLNRAVEEAEAAGGPSNWTTLLYFYRGMARDLLGQHGDSINDYERVMAAPPFAGLQEETKLCLLNRCDRSEVLRTLLVMSTAGSPAADSLSTSAAVPIDMTQDPDDQE